MTQNSKIVAFVDTFSAGGKALLAQRPDIVLLPFPQGAKGADWDAILKANPRIHAVILSAQPVSTPQLALAPALQVVARVGVGFDMIDVPSLAPRGIPLMTSGTANSPSVAEAAFHLIFALIKRGRDQDQVVREGRWAAGRIGSMPGDIFGKTVLVAGFGRIGSRFVKRALAMEMDVMVFDPYVAPEKIIATGAIPVARLDDALPFADIVTLHCPRTPDTIGMIDARRMALMKPSALLINTARGGLVDEVALHAALTRGKLAGAGLDVLEREPPPTDHPLFALPNVVFAPHMAGVTREALDRMSISAAENVLSVFDGTPIIANVINAEVLTKGR